MELVKVSPKYQVVIPQLVRKGLKIYPGERIYVLQYENRIEFIPEKNHCCPNSVIPAIF